MGKLFEEICGAIKDINPDFDKENPEDLDIMTKCFILSVEETDGGKEIKEDYMKEVVEKGQHYKLDKMIKDKGHTIVKYELGKLNLEKEILERKIEITKRYLD